MSKNKIIAIVVWAFTLFVPLANWMFMEELGNGVMYLVWFLLAVTLTFVGAYFFSKKDKANA